MQAPRTWLYWLWRHSQEFGQDPYVAAAISFQESTWLVDTTSVAGTDPGAYPAASLAREHHRLLLTAISRESYPPDIGPWQINARTHNWVDPWDMMQPAGNSYLAHAHILACRQLYPGDRRKQVGCYRCPADPLWCGGDINNERDYISPILDVYYPRIYAEGLEPVPDSAFIRGTPLLDFGTIYGRLVEPYLAPPGLFVPRLLPDGAGWEEPPPPPPPKTSWQLAALAIGGTLALALLLRPQIYKKKVIIAR